MASPAGVCGPFSGACRALWEPPPGLGQADLHREAVWRGVSDGEKQTPALRGASCPRRARMELPQEQQGPGHGAAPAFAPRLTADPDPTTRVSRLPFTDLKSK